MREIDFTTALARLLRDPGQRAAFARDAAAVAAQFGVRAADRTAFERLAPEELEAQARVLVRKRFREIEDLLPATCAALGAMAWTLFRAQAQGEWPASASADALAFAGRLRAGGQRVADAEVNRLNFAAGDRWLALHLVRENPARFLPAGQLLFRRGSRVWEWSICVGW